MHIPVLLSEIILEIKNNFFNSDNNSINNNIFIDCTFGFGGYSCAILNEFNDARVIAFEIDPDSLQYANAIKKQFPERFTIINANFANITEELLKINITQVAAIIADLGVSSMQLDSQERGFAFSHDAKLDMRMNKTGLDAYTVINTYDEKKLSDIIYCFGEEKFAKRIAKNIINSRKLNSIETTNQFAKIVQDAIPYKYSKTHPATKTYQAIRIFVNNELENLKQLLLQTKDLLINNGMLAIVSFHSLEDRIVKEYIKTNSNIKLQQSKYALKHNADNAKQSDSINAHIQNDSKNNNLFDIRAHKLICPTQQEINANYRARSAKLRITKKK